MLNHKIPLRHLKTKIRQSDRLEVTTRSKAVNKTVAISEESPTNIFGDVKAMKLNQNRVKSFPTTIPSKK